MRLHGQSGAAGKAFALAACIGVAATAGVCAADATGRLGAGRETWEPIPTGHPEDNKPAIDWRDTWEQTYEVNLERWKQELTPGRQRRRPQVIRLGVRKINLLRAMVERFRPAEDARIAAYQEILDELVRMRRFDRANYYRRKLAEEFPGRLALAAEALYGILQRPGKGEAFESTIYAADRLLALNDAGYLGDRDEWVLAALREKLDAYISAGRLAEAAGVLERLRDHGPKDPVRANVREAELLFYAGRTQDALALCEAIRDVDEDAVLRSHALRYLKRYAQTYEPVLPRRMEVTAQWHALRAGQVDDEASALDELFAALSGRTSLVEGRDGLHASTWRAAARRGAGTEALCRRLRALQEPTARALLEDAGDADSLAAAMAVFRRCPFAASAHRVLLAAGERALRRGAAGIARRAFQDVLAYSQDGGLRASARVGLWTALAQGRRGRRELTRAYEQVKPDARLPWLGEAQSAEAIYRRLLASAEEHAPQGRAAAVPSPKLAQTPLAMPAVAAWAPGQFYDLPAQVLQSLWYVHGQVIACGGDQGGVLVCGPSLLARFDWPGGALRWLRTPRLAGQWIGGFRRDSGSDVILPAPLRPAVRGGAVYCRWGLDRRRAHPTTVASFDLDTGRMRWSTAGGETWRELAPISEPAVGDASPTRRVYVLAAKGEVHVNTPIHLVCLSAADGRTLWTRKLGHHGLSVRAPRRSVLKGRRLDVARYGSALAVRDGQVFVSTCAGFVARCDARDGRIEWARSYERADSYEMAFRVVRRGGAAPVITDRSVIFVPRDALGVFALDRRSGEKLWDNPFAASDHVVGLEAPDGEAGGIVLLSEARGVCGLEAATGKQAWLRRFPDGLCSRPVLCGQSVYVPTHAGLTRLDARTGIDLDRASWQRERLFDFVVRGGAAVGIGRRPHGSAGVSPPLPVPAEKQPPPFSLPLRRCWHLERAVAKLYPAPADASAKGGGRRAALLSRGLLECLTLAPAYSVAWRVRIVPGVEHVIWSGQSILAVYADSLASFDAGTGRLRWRLAWPDEVDLTYVLGRYLVARHGDKGRYVLGVDLKTGRLLWQRNCAEGLIKGSRGGVTAFGRDGQDLCVLVEEPSRKGGSTVLVCRPSDGRVLATHPFPREGRGKGTLAVLSDGVGLYVGGDRRVREFRLGEDSASVTYSAAIPQKEGYSKLYPKALDLIGGPRGRWIRVRYGPKSDGFPDYCLILRRGDPDYALFRRHEGQVRGERFYGTRADTLRIVDLPTRDELVRCQIPDVYPGHGQIVGFRQDEKAICTVAFARTSRSGPARLRADAFDRRTGEHLGGQVLDLRYWTDFDTSRRNRRRAFSPAGGAQPTLRWNGSDFLLTTPHGLSVYRPGVEKDAPLYVAQPAPRAVEIDGSLSEWDASSSRPLERTQAAPPGFSGRMLISHDDEHVYLAVEYADDDARPWRGGGRYAGGDSLEIGLQTNLGRYRYLVGWDEDGRIRAEPFRSPDEIEGLRAAVRHDPARRRTAYELAVPRAKVIYAGKAGWRDIRLSLIVWDARAGRGPAPVARVGAALEAPHMASSRHQRVHLARRLHRQETACLAVLQAAPALDASLDFLRDFCRVRRRDPPLYDRLCTALLRRQARSPLALRLLAVIDQALRARACDDPTERVLALARAAGVDEATRRSYRAMAGTYLSQWVYLDSRKGFTSLMIQLNDGGEGKRGWAHRVFWGYDKYSDLGALNTPSRQAAGWIGPAGQWTELRVPLIWLDMHDRAIHGVSFVLWGSMRLDRTAVGRGEREQVLVDDSLPGGKEPGKLAWDSDRAKSGTRSLKVVQEPWQTCRLDVAMPRAAVIHLTRPPRTPLPLDRQAAVAALRAKIPELIGTRYGRRFFHELLRLEAADDPAKKAELYKWLLKNGAAGREAYEALVHLRSCYAELKLKDAAERLDAAVTECNVPPDVAYSFRMNYLSSGGTYVQSWQVIGPFASRRVDKPAQEHPIESAPVDLTASYAAAEGKVRWRAYESKSTCVSLAEALGAAENAFGYAACWVHSDRAQPAVIEFGVDDLGKVWLNGQAVLSYAGGSASPRQARAHVRLRAGWNELLVRVTNRERRWRFYLELVSPDGRGRPKDARVTNTPPARKSSGD